MIQPTTETDDAADAAWFAAPAPAPALSKAERAERLTLDSYTGQAWSLCMQAGEQLLKHELNTFAGTPIPLYIVPVNLCPSEHGQTSAGMQHPYFDVLLRKVIERNFSWAGRGPCVVINNQGIYRDCKDRDSFLSEFCAVSLHEFGHLIQSAPFHLADAVPLSHIENLKKQLSEKHTGPCDTTPEPWDHHNLSYVRFCVHLVWRARRLAVFSFPIRLDDVFCAEYYGLSAVEEYAAAFSDEPARLAKIPLSMLDVFDMPEAATRLFSDDCERWRARHPNQPASTTV